MTEIGYYFSLYDSAGLTTIPIKSGKKAPPPKGWKTKSSADLWANAPRDSNIAVRVGDQEVFLIDPDDGQSVLAVGRE